MTVQVYILLILPCPPASPALRVLLQTLPPSHAQVPSVNRSKRTFLALQLDLEASTMTCLIRLVQVDL
jgi:hypothetical protein